ncbi:MAG: PIN domain-containing protein [Antricoccus sp.]
MTLAEVRFGLVGLAAGRRRDELVSAADDVFATFADHVLPFDNGAASHYADIVVERERRSAPIAGFDAQIAAICRSRRAALATHNTSYFSQIGLELVDPWLPSS